MGYRRSSNAIRELRRYRISCQTNSELIERAGLPSSVIEDYHAFIYFLMHGSTWSGSSHPVWLEVLSKEQKQAYLQLLDRYFDMDFANPGLMGLTAEQHSELEAKHPDWKSR